MKRLLIIAGVVLVAAGCMSPELRFADATDARRYLSAIPAPPVRTETNTIFEVARFVETTVAAHPTGSRISIDIDIGMKEEDIRFVPSRDDPFSSEPPTLEEGCWTGPVVSGFDCEGLSVEQVLTISTTVSLTKWTVRNGRIAIVPMK